VNRLSIRQARRVIGRFGFLQLDTISIAGALGLEPVW